MLELVTKAKPDRFDETCSCLIGRLTNRPVVAPCDIICFGVQVALVMEDPNQGQVFLTQQGDAAQSLLDLLQALLSYPKLNNEMRRIFRYALTKLATKSGRYPQCLHLRNLAWDGIPISSGHFGDLFKGSVIGRPDRPVAGKVVRVYEHGSRVRFLKNFANEAAVWSQLRHPNVVPLYSVFWKESAPCLVSPFVENGNLRAYLKQNPVADRKLLALDIARGLEYLHGEKPTIIHADIKGDNVLITKSGHACLVDFGLSTAKDAGLVQVPSTTPAIHAAAWTAPEILEHHSLVNSRGHGQHTTMSDMYSFGCVCYEIFCNQIPFFGKYDCISLVKQGKCPERLIRYTWTMTAYGSS
ncbi:kinase-like protein, partial [Coniophora puteana RWD-64-598 SS2]